MNGWIGVDLDGTLAKYDKWRGVQHIGEPVLPIVQAVKEKLAEGWEVRIFTARVSSPKDLPETVNTIERWCLEHIGRVLPITNVKDFGMVELWDDRCKQVIPNEGIFVL